MQRTTLYKNTRLIAAAIMAVSMLAAGTAAGMISRVYETKPPAKIDYLGRFVITPYGTQFIAPEDSTTR